MSVYTLKRSGARVDVI